jgi:hypothetical protein
MGGGMDRKYFVTANGTLKMSITSDQAMLLRTKEKAPRVSTKCLIHWEFLVGNTSFELATPAV